MERRAFLTTIGVGLTAASGCLSSGSANSQMTDPSTDTTESTERDRFEATLVEADETVERTVGTGALEERGREAIDEVQESTGNDVVTAIEEGHPASVIDEYARGVDADMVAMGTRGRHGENRFLIGSVAERVVRTCPVPVLTVRQLEE